MRRLKFLALAGALCGMLAGLHAHAEMVPILLQEEPGLKDRLHFGMSHGEFVERLGISQVNCKPGKATALAEMACSLPGRRQGGQVAEITGLFQGNLLVALVARFGIYQHAQLGHRLSTHLGQPTLAVAECEGDVGDEACRHPFEFWMHRGRALYLTKPIHNHSPANGFILAIESPDPTFVDRLNAEALRRSGVRLPALQLQAASQENIGEFTIAAD